MLNKLSLFFNRNISLNMLNASFSGLMELYYSHFKEFDTKKEFKQDPKTLEMESLIKGLIKEYPYLIKLSAYGGLK